MKKFTLIELLIVIGIFALLLTLLLPSLRQARESAKAAICASNQSQIYRGSVIWSKNYNGWLPFGWREDKYKFAYGLTWGVGNNSGSPVERPIALGWVVRDQIIGHADLFYCPSGPYSLDTDAWDSLYNGNYSNQTRVRIDYTMNAGLQYLKPGDEPTLESGSKMLITQIENKGVMTETVNWGIPHKRFAVTTYSDGQVKMIKSPLLLQQGLGNNTADWLNLWNAINDKF